MLAKHQTTQLDIYKNAQIEISVPLMNYVVQNIKFDVREKIYSDVDFAIEEEMEEMVAGQILDCLERKFNGKG